MRLLISATTAAAMATFIGFAHVQLATGTTDPAVTVTAAQQCTQVPGYYRMALGDDVMTALYDGYTDLLAKTLFDLNTQSVQNLLMRMFVSSTPGMQMAINSFLIGTGGKRILVDTGSDTCPGPTMDGLVGNVHASGYQPEQIDAVLLMHLHPGRAHGLLMLQGQPALTNAQVYVAIPKADF